MSVKNRPFGLYIVKERSAIPLKSIYFDVRCKGISVELKIIQEYENNRDTNVECEYIFPIGVDMALSKLRIYTEEWEIKGRLEGVEVAELEYSDAIASGHNPISMRYLEGMNDIVSIKIGKLGAGKIVNVEVGVGELVEIGGRGEGEMRIPTTYIPRYHSCEDRQPTSNALPQNFVPGESISYGWSVGVEVEAPGELLYVRCSQLLQEVEAGGSRYFGVVNSTHIPNEDVVITYCYKGMGLPSLLLQYSQQFDEYAALFSISPKLPNQHLEESKDSEESKNPPQSTESSKEMCRGEHIFILDCSGSMSGGKIRMAREAAALFIRSLPIDSLFNIIFFGSDLRLLFPSSLKYSDLNLNKALRELKNLEANMGGTEIMGPLMAVYGREVDDMYPRNIYLLTDGGVGNPQHIIDEIRRHSHHTRVHTFGIGNGASEHLVKGAAHAGRGGFQFAAGHEEIAPKIIRSLARGCKPALSMPQLKWPGDDDHNILLQFPVRGRMESVYLDEPFIAFAIFKTLPESLLLQFSAVDTQKGCKIEFKEEFSRDQRVGGEGLFQIAVKRLLNYDERLSQKEKLEISLKYSVLSEETAFIGIQELKGEEGKNNEIEAVRIPVCITKDYADNPYMDNMLGLLGASSTFQGQGGGFLLSSRARNTKSASCCGGGGGGGYSTPKIPKTTTKMGNQQLKTENKEGYADIIQYQKWTGEWEMEEWITKYYKKSLSHIKSNLPQILLDVGLSKKETMIAFATIFALKLLEVKYKDDQECWSLLYKKGVNYLADKGIHLQFLNQIMAEIHI